VVKQSGFAERINRPQRPICFIRQHGNSLIRHGRGASESVNHDDLAAKLVAVISPCGCPPHRHSHKSGYSEPPRLSISGSCTNPAMEDITCGQSGTTLAVLETTDLSAIQNCTTIQGSVYVHAPWSNNTLSLPASLQTVTGGLFCTGLGVNGFMAVIEGLGLKAVATDENETATVGTGLVISDYANLTALNFPSLEMIGSNFILTRNDQLVTLSGFDNLTTVKGNVDLTGNFQRVAMPALQDVSGSVNIQSTSDTFQCPVKSNVVSGNSSFVCAGGVSNPRPLAVDNSTTNPLNLTASSSASPSGTSSTGAPSDSASPHTSSASLGNDYGLISVGMETYRVGLQPFVMFCFGGFLLLELL